MSETSICRHLVVEYCQGNGVDIGSGGDPVVPWAIQVELPQAEFDHYGHAHAQTQPIQWRGDGAHLPFMDQTLDFVFSSHLLEDFDDWSQILREWIRVLKPGGHLIIMVPDHERFRAAVRAGQPDNSAHRHEAQVGELTRFANFIGGMIVIRDDFTNIRGPNDYNILFIARKS